MSDPEAKPDNIIDVDFSPEQGQAVRESCIKIGSMKTIEALLELGFRRSYAVAMIKKYAGFLKQKKA